MVSLGSGHWPLSTNRRGEHQLVNWAVAMRTVGSQQTVAAVMPERGLRSQAPSRTGRSVSSRLVFGDPSRCPSGSTASGSSGDESSAVQGSSGRARSAASPQRFDGEIREDGLSHWVRSASVGGAHPCKPPSSPLTLPGQIRCRQCSHTISFPHTVAVQCRHSRLALIRTAWGIAMTERRAP